MKAFALNIGLFPCPQPWLLAMPHPAPDSPAPTLSLFTSPRVCPSVAGLGTKLAGTEVRVGVSRAALVEWALCWVVGMCGDLCGLSGGQGAAVFVLTLEAVLSRPSALRGRLCGPPEEVRHSPWKPGTVLGNVLLNSRLENQRQGQERRARCQGYLSLFGLWSPSAGRQLEKEGWEEKGTTLDRARDGPGLGPNRGRLCGCPAWGLLGPLMGGESCPVTGLSPDACSTQVGDINDGGGGGAQLYDDGDYDRECAPSKYTPTTCFPKHSFGWINSFPLPSKLASEKVGLAEVGSLPLEATTVPRN